jgi:hypothetical protein
MLWAAIMTCRQRQTTLLLVREEVTVNVGGLPARGPIDDAKGVPMAGSVTLSFPVSKWPAFWRRKLASESAVKVKSYQPKNLCRSLK